MKRVKKFLTLFLVICLSVTMLPTSVFGASFTDTSGHWAESIINDLADQGILTGRGGSSFAPNDNVTRAEYFTMINNAFGYTVEANISFNDVGKSDWFYSQISRAVAAGYLAGYEDNTARPNNNITRAEAGAILSRTLKLPSAPGAGSIVKDYSSIPAWAVNDIDAVIGAGIMQGDTAGFRSNDNLTRAEAAVMINKGRSYEQPQVPPATGVLEIFTNYGKDSVETIDRDVEIKGAVAELKNLVINGDLTIYGTKVTLNNVTVTGKIIIESEADLYINNNSSTSDVYVNNAAGIHTENIKDGKTGDIIINAKNKKVSLYGKYENVDVLSESTKLTLEQDGYVELMHITESAKSSSITVKKDSVIEKIVIDAACSIYGSGKINVADISVTGVKAEKGVIQKYAAGSKTASSTVASSGGGGGGGGGNPVPPSGDIDKTALRKQIDAAYKLLESVWTVPVGGSADDAPYGESWIYQNYWDALHDLYQEAMGINSSSTATQAEVNSINNKLIAAIKEFQDNIKDGSNSGKKDTFTESQDGRDYTLGISNLFVTMVQVWVPDYSEVDYILINGDKAVKGGNDDYWYLAFPEELSYSQITVKIVWKSDVDPVTPSDFLDKDGSVFLELFGETWVYVSINDDYAYDSYDAPKAYLNGTEYALQWSDTTKCFLNGKSFGSAGSYSEITIKTDAQTIILPIS